MLLYRRIVHCRNLKIEIKPEIIQIKQNKINHFVEINSRIFLRLKSPNAKTNVPIVIGMVNHTKRAVKLCIDSFLSASKVECIASLSSS